MPAIEGVTLAQPKTIEKEEPLVSLTAWSQGDLYRLGDLTSFRTQFDRTLMRTFSRARYYGALAVPALQIFWIMSALLVGISFVASLIAVLFTAFNWIYVPVLPVLVAALLFVLSFPWGAYHQVLLYRRLETAVAKWNQIVQRVKAMKNSEVQAALNVQQLETLEQYSEHIRNDCRVEMSFGNPVAVCELPDQLLRLFIQEVNKLHESV